MDLPLWARLFVGMGVAFGIAYTTTPVAVVAARRLAFYDVPAGYKGHKLPTPYLGGAAVMVAFVIALLIGFPSSRSALLVGGVAVLFALGTIDDRVTVSPLLRVAVEFALGVLLSELGHGWHLGAGRHLDAAVTGIWIVAVVNAFNLFDNMDGAASTMAIVASAGTGVLALVAHNDWAATASFALCGACLGFLPHNLSKPARIFLGDGGSLPVGFTVAALTASAARHAEPSLLALLTGLGLVGIPAMDTCLVMVSRRRRGISILTGGQDHLTHRTRQRVQTASRVALVLGGTQALVSALVIAATRADTSAVVYVVLGFVICAATAIMGLEARMAAAGPGSGGETLLTDPSLAHPERSDMGTSARLPAGRASSSPAVHAAALAMLVILGLGAGLSPLFSGYYSATTWVPIALAVAVLAAAAAVARPPWMGLPAGLALSGVAGLALWSLLSTSWAQAVEQATVDANLWFAYAALLLLLLVLTRTRRHAEILLLAVGLGIAGVGVSVLVRMLGSDPAQLFVGGRLNSPLGYINGEGCIFAMGCWLSLALAERRQPLLAGLGAAATVAMGSLALLSQSRGAALATLVAVIVALLVVPGIRRRTLALVIIGAGLAAAATPVLHVYSTAHGGPVHTSVAQSAATAILLSSAATGIVWGLLSAAGGWIEQRDAQSARLLGRVATTLTVLCIALPIVGGLARFSSIERTARNQWHAFVTLSATTNPSTSATQTRLLSGGGNRYDYWRVAWNVFENHPIIGVGAGNYTSYYFQQRRSQEAIQNPHSIEMQTLSELGIVGALLLALLVGGVALGALRLRRRARVSPLDRTLMVGATGVFVVWLVDTSGDWMHLLPGVTAAALSAAVVLCRRPDDTPAVAGRPGALGWRTLAGAAALAFVLVFAGASLLRTEFVQRYLASAQNELGTDPAAAITDAGRALHLDAENLDAYYVYAAAQARFNRAAAARSELLTAARRDPHDFITWVLLGDLEVRLHAFRTAKQYYGRAHRLAPNDPTLAQLAADPAQATASAPG